MRCKSRLRGARPASARGCPAVVGWLGNLVGSWAVARGRLDFGALLKQASRSWAPFDAIPLALDLLSPSIELLVRAVAGMERADVQQEAALETAAQPKVQRQQEQQRIQPPCCISPRHPRLQLPSLANTQLETIPAQMPNPRNAAAGVGGGSALSAKIEQEQPADTDRQVLLAQAADSEGQEGEEGHSQRQCSHCGTIDPVGSWRRHPRTSALLCHACGQFATTNNCLPSATVLQRRKQQRQLVASSKLRHVPPHQRQCLQCGVSKPGAGRSRWRQHPATKEGWLCNACCQKERRQLKRKRQHEAALTSASSDSGEESREEDEEAQPPHASPVAPQQQATPVQPAMPGSPVHQRVPAASATDHVAEARQQQHLQALSQHLHPQGANRDAAQESGLEQQAALPARKAPPQSSTGLLVLEAAQQAAAVAAGLTEVLAGSFVALLPLPVEQDECLRLMLQHRQYGGVAGLMRAVLHVRGIPHHDTMQHHPST